METPDSPKPGTDKPEPDAAPTTGTTADGAPVPEGEEGATAEASGKVSRRNVLRSGGLVLGGAALGTFVGYQIAGSDEGGAEGKGDAAPGEKVWKIGAVIPKKAPFLGEGQETARGLDLGLKVLDGRGGLGGREVVLVTEEVSDLTEASMMAAAQSLVAQEVVAVVLGFTSPTCGEFSTYAEYGVPVFHLSTSLASLDAATAETTSIFRCVPVPLDYGAGFASSMAKIEASGDLAPGKRTVAIVTTDDPDGDAIAESMVVAVGQLGWSVSMNERVTTPVADWEPLLAELRGKAPTAIFLGVPDAPDLAAFQIAFAADPFRSLVYATFGPSVPEYLDLAGEAADGVIWATPIGTIPDALSATFRELYERKYGKSSMGYSQAGANYDLVLFWAQCAALAKRPSKFSQVSKIVPEVVYRGVSGVFNLDNESRVALGYPGGTKDPSAGLPHLTFQIQGQEQVLLGPAPYIGATFVAPAWI